jgi:hypothetical protein
MSISSNRPRAPEGQALLAGHALDGLAREDRFGVVAIAEDLLHDPTPINPPGMAHERRG